MNLRKMLIAGATGALLALPALNALAAGPGVDASKPYCPAPSGSSTGQNESTYNPGPPGGSQVNQTNPVDGSKVWVQLATNGSGNIGASGPHGHIQAEGSAPARGGSINGYSKDPGNVNGYIGTDSSNDGTGHQCVGAGGGTPVGPKSVDAYTPAI